VAEIAERLPDLRGWRVLAMLYQLHIGANVDGPGRLEHGLHPEHLRAAPQFIVTADVSDRR
jgi:hypothetical protein